VPEGYGVYHHQDASWEEEEEEEEDDDDMLTVPKLEPLEDEDFCMDDLQEAPSASTLRKEP
jgi:hypothetical protein